MVDIVRGNTVKFTVTFRDANGNIFAPAFPRIGLAFNSNQRKTVSLTADGSSFIAEWDSSEVRRGFSSVSWTVYSGDVPKIAEQGSFRVTSNPASFVAG